MVLLSLDLATLVRRLFLVTFATLLIPIYLFVFNGRVLCTQYQSGPLSLINVPLGSGFSLPAYFVACCILHSLPLTNPPSTKTTPKLSSNCASISTYTRGNYLSFKTQVVHCSVSRWWSLNVVGIWSIVRCTSAVCQVTGSPWPFALQCLLYLRHELLLQRIRSTCQFYGV